MQHYITRCPRDGSKAPRIIATFTSAAQDEAIACFAYLQVGGTHAGSDIYVYSLTQDAPLGPLNKVTHQDTQVNLTEAWFTRRPIKFTLSCTTMHGRRQYIAFNRYYGKVTGSVPDSGHGGHLFLSRLSTVWPNADIAS